MAPAENNLEARRPIPSERTTEADTQNERTPAAASSANGSEELAVAQRYLSGGGGQRRDGTEAAKWLWKSIAKHNSEATLLLADLYLKGDGVSKNCDQARVLLDSAARKGMAGAGERLRNLQAFGCR
jgi:TPR repeat protein